MYEEREINLSFPFEYSELKKFLSSLGLKVPSGIDYCVGIYDSRGELVASGSLVGNIIQGVGVDPSLQGEGLSARIVTELLNKGVELGWEKLFIFTKTEEARKFEDLGFRLIESVKGYASFLEWGSSGIEDFRKDLEDISKDKPSNASCIVVNCNPFTNGHRYLIERAASESSHVYVIVVREDRSLFPFDVRYELVQKGVNHLENVTVLSGGDYVISNLTFPSYFTRDDSLTPYHATLDIKVFAKYVAPSLKVKRRYVGEEPYCPVTSTYNSYMEKILPDFGIEFIVIPRLQHGEKAVSASTVRDMIRSGRIEEVKEIVPETTYDFLTSKEAEGIIENIKKSNSRH